MKFHFQITVIVAAAMAASGCGVTAVGVGKRADDAQTEIKAASESADAKFQTPSSRLRKMDGNFLGAQTMKVSQAASLPPHVRNVTLAFGSGRGDIETVARNIRQATGLGVRINPDVFADPMNQSVPVSVDPGPGVGGQPALLPIPSTASLSDAQSSGLVAGGPIPMSFKGDLADYLDGIASAMGINWEYAQGQIKFYRLMTRTFQLALSPGQVDYKDEVASGGSGGGSSTGSATAGTFASSSTASANALLTPWQDVDNAVKSMLSTSGSAVVNVSSATIVVTDTRERVERIGELIAQKNDLLNRQVRIDVREIMVEDSSNSGVGFDVNLVYTRLLASGVNISGAAADGAAAVTGTPNYSVLSTAQASSLVDPASGTMALNIQRGYFNGSSVAAQAITGIGKVVNDSTRTVITTNRMPGRVQDVTDRAYLAETTPGTGGGDTGSAVPGLKPGIVTYGDNMTIVPTIINNGDVLMQLFSTRSNLIELNTVSAGEGSTFQQINTPVLARSKISQVFRIRNGDTLVIVSNASEAQNARSRASITGASTNASKTRVMSVLMVTPRIMGI